MNIPEYMRGKSEGYYYLSAEDSELLNKAIAGGDAEVANLLLRIAAASRSAHCAEKY